MFTTTKAYSDTKNTAADYGQNKIRIEAACLSTDTKPTDGVANGSVCIEMDTGKVYMFDETNAEWLEWGGSSAIAIVGTAKVGTAVVG